jgi:hypothetical protein
VGHSRPITCIALIAALLATSGAASAVDLTGQASVIDGDTTEIPGTRIRLWGIDAPESTQRCRGEDNAARRQRTISTHSSRAGQLAAHPSHWINTGAPSPLAAWATLILGNGSSVTVSRSIGRIIPVACTARSNERPSMPGAACGRAATSRRGFIGRASGRAASQPDVRTTRMRIPKHARPLRALVSYGAYLGRVACKQAPGVL